MRRRRVRWKIQLMTWRLETTTGMWKEKEQAARAFANAVVKSGLRGWVESDIVGIRAIVDMEMGGTLRTYKQAFKGASEGAHFACEDASIERVSRARVPYYVPLKQIACMVVGTLRE